MQFVVGKGAVPKHVPRAEMEAGDPRDVTLAPKVTLVNVTDVWVGVMTVGTDGWTVVLTTTLAQALQLFSVFDSLTGPKVFLLLLLAQARTEYVPVVGKV